MRIILHSQELKEAVVAFIGDAMGFACSVDNVEIYDDVDDGEGIRADVLVQPAQGKEKAE